MRRIRPHYCFDTHSAGTASLLVSVGSEALGGLPVVGPVAGVIGAIPGHIIGRIKASNVRERYPESFLQEDEIEGSEEDATLSEGPPGAQ